MKHNTLLAISPLDGRYYLSLTELSNYFSEYALIRARLYVEITYLKILSHHIPSLSFLQSLGNELDSIVATFGLKAAYRVKHLEERIGHDVKAVEYHLRTEIQNRFQDTLTPHQLNLTLAHIHFGLTSQDINNTAIPWLWKQFIHHHYLPLLSRVIGKMEEWTHEWKSIPLLALTHGQPATPTTLGKEIGVFASRLHKPFSQLQQFHFPAKFGGATGNFNAHLIAYPDVDWERVANEVAHTLGLHRNPLTTQIDPYDSYAELSHLISRINTILIDFAQDMWLYISRGIFVQKVVRNEVGSSTMPHKVNPIHFENAEGNLKLANALLEFFAQKLPISRLQRDLTDSTVLRNIGTAMGHSYLALQNLLKGMERVQPNPEKMQQELEDNPEVLAEAIQSILRKHGIPNAYEQLKELTRSGNRVSLEQLHHFILKQPIPEEEKKKLLHLRPSTYTGLAEALASGLTKLSSGSDHS
jgi:adenylosuccinate lyase